MSFSRTIVIKFVTEETPYYYSPRKFDILILYIILIFYIMYIIYFEDCVSQAYHFVTAEVAIQGAGFHSKAPIEENTSTECIRNMTAKCGCKILQLHEYETNKCGRYHAAQKTEDYRAEVFCVILTVHVPELKC